MFAAKNNMYFILEFFFQNTFEFVVQKWGDEGKKPNFVGCILYAIDYPRFFMNAIGLLIYTQFVSTTEIRNYVSISLPAAKPYLLAHSQEGLSKLQEDNSFLQTTEEHGWFWIKLLKEEESK